MPRADEQLFGICDETEPVTFGPLLFTTSARADAKCADSIQGATLGEESHLCGRFGSVDHTVKHSELFLGRRECGPGSRGRSGSIEWGP
jgi:hypothetical protein